MNDARERAQDKINVVACAFLPKIKLYSANNRCDTQHVFYPDQSGLLRNTPTQMHKKMYLTGFL